MRSNITPEPGPIWRIQDATDQGSLIFQGTYDDFENCYGGGSGNSEADIVGWAWRQWGDKVEVLRRVDTDYIKGFRE